MFVKFLCGRPGCGEESTVTLQINAPGSTISLLDPRETRDGTPLCDRHAELTTPPMGWSMNDMRSSQGRKLLAVPTGDEVPTKVAKSRSAGSRAAKKEASQEPRTNTDAVTFSKRNAIPKSKKAKVRNPNKRKAKAPQSRPAKRREQAEPAVATNENEFPWHHQFDEEDQPENLQAKSRLLSRAFRTSVG